MVSMIAVAGLEEFSVLVSHCHWLSKESTAVVTLLLLSYKALHSSKILNKTSEFWKKIVILGWSIIRLVEHVNAVIFPIELLSVILQFQGPPYITVTV